MPQFEVKGDKRFLVIGRVGDTSLHQEWLQPAKYKNFDLCLSYFGSTPGRYAKECDFYHEIPGLKWPTVKDTIAAFGDGIYHYDAIWMPDDDISANAYDINRMFKIFMEQGLELAQPALTPDSYFGHGITVQNPNYFLRYSHFIEPMVPLYSRETFQKLLPTFEKSESGWGLDFVWPKLLGFPYKKLAVIDDVTVKHTRRVGGGELYKNISGSQWDHLKRVTEEYEAPVNFRMTHYDGIPASKRVIFAILGRKDECVLATQIDNIRKFNPEAGIVLYNGGDDIQFAKSLNVALCPYGHHLTGKHAAPFLWDVMKWLEENKVKYEYLVNLDDEMLFVKHGFESYLNETMQGFDCMGWDMQTSSDEESMHTKPMREEWAKWAHLFKTDHFIRYLNPIQVYRHRIVKKMLAFTGMSKIENMIDESQVTALEEVLFVTLAAACGGRYREFPRDHAFNVMRHEREIEQNEAHHAQHHPYYYAVHPVRGDRLIHFNGQLMSGGIPMEEPQQDVPVVHQEQAPAAEVHPEPQPEPQEQQYYAQNTPTRRQVFRRVITRKRLVIRKKKWIRKKPVSKKKMVLKPKNRLLKPKTKMTIVKKYKKRSGLIQRPGPKKVSTVKRNSLRKPPALRKRIVKKVQSRKMKKAA
ncbi:DUF707 domain-containing protein [Paenibacillus sedimenti]|uniref:DUF707 domain-containing protein n=1 Tax=Paenibacillus sedimenti TaxID=2770274 RepID=A0A926KPF5_9BACL|nr:DUF707 domain-containing protein [Paenibacillus sedimenti]MBD0381587.1 DUF707 domain-containing protein [Paenibacillus sedimenti]